jgi:hypothetical protein
MISDDELWLLSFYRLSEINGALFFGRLARSVPPGPVQRDLTQHFADEAQHASYWTQCIDALGAKPIKLDHAYQDNYLAAAGIPANLMEVLAITQVFEARVIGSYTVHRRQAGLSQPIADTLTRIMKDEQWHLRWVGDALRALETEYGADHVAKTIERFRAADHEVYHKVTESRERIAAMFSRASSREKESHELDRI